MTLQIGWPMGMPLARKLADNLWECRSTLSEGNARILFTVREDKIVLLHGFIKKSQKTPQRDLHVAHQRLRKL
jgi:phage-related protein